MAVAPIAFRVLSGADVAGRLVSPLLRSLHLYGLFAGIALAAIAAWERRRPLYWVTPLVLAGLCAVTEFGITGSLQGIRPHELGAGSPADAAGRFAELHRLSQLIFGGVWLGAWALLLVNAREDAREDPSGLPGSRAKSP